MVTEEEGLEEDDRLSLLMFPNQYSDEKGEPFEEWCSTSNIQEDGQTLYDGHRCVLEKLCRNAKKSFKPIPSTAAWMLRKVGGPWTDAKEAKLIPSLEDEARIYALLPTSAALATEHAKLCAPNPDARSPAAGTYMAQDVWFEDCGDGGVWIVGCGGDVFIMYVDSPGDMVCGRYKCSRKRWAEMWLATFGAMEVTRQSI